MRFQVPQNLDVPDTVFWGLNFVQLLYLGGAAGFLVFLYLFVGGITSSIVFGSPVVLLACLLSFLTYNNRPFLSIFWAFIHFISRKKTYFWRQSDVDTRIELSARNIKSESSLTDSISRGHDSYRLKKTEVNLIFDDDTVMETEPDVAL